MTLFSLKRNNNDNVIGVELSTGGNMRERAERVDAIADSLVKKFDAPTSRDFFCKCAWKLSENDIWCAYEQAHGKKIKSPLKYFVAVCNIKMGA